ncbi:MAG: hypothetical protein DAHOPDDO_00803 [Ignavibacteriaceae bacterium]|nr:hypothetical protein [Ignavibacteriaceae bacterium]
MEEFLIGGGLALLIALLAWSDQIQSMQRETREAEKYLLEKRKINWIKIKKMIRKEANPTQILETLNELLTKESFENIDDINVITHFKSLLKKSNQLEHLYTVKYILVIVLTASFFLSGFISFFLNKNCLICILTFSLNLKFLPVIICILFSLFVLSFVIYLNIKETKYRSDFINLMEDI